jgi:hypothetical protein
VELLEPASATDDFCSCPSCAMMAHHLIKLPDPVPQLSPRARALMELARGTSSPELYKRYLMQAMHESGAPTLYHAQISTQVTRTCVFCAHEWTR